MKAVLLSALLLLTPTLFAEEINWLGYEEARALNSDKPIFVFAKMRFCGACIKMEEQEFTNPELAKLINTHYVPVKETINFGFSKFVFEDLKDKNGDTLKFSGFPSVMLVQGDEYALSQGYKTADNLIDILSNKLN